MNRNLVFGVAFAAFFLLHFLYTILRAKHLSSAWTGEESDYLAAYVRGGKIYTGYSYALAGAFAAYGLIRFMENRKRGLGGAAGGALAGGTVLLFGCFMIGCCGSPMLPVYLSIFGAAYAKFTRPLVAAATTIFILTGYLRMNMVEKRLGEKDREFFELQMKRIEEISAIRKCAGCSCYQDILKEFQNKISLMAGCEDVKARIAELLSECNVNHDCLGCDPCHPVDVSNRLYEFESSPSECDCPACGDAMENTWPVEPGEYIVGRKSARIAIATLASGDLPELISKKIGMGNIAIAGKMETENIGMEKVVKNVVSNPAIRFLILCGRDGTGHHSGQSLLSLMESGTDGSDRVINAAGRRPALKNLRPEEINHFRKQVAVSDLIGVEDIDEIRKEIERLAKRKTRDFTIRPVPVSAKTMKAARPGKTILDESGFFIIIVDDRNKTIILEHYNSDGVLSTVIEGTDAVSIYSTAISRSLLGRLDHAAYLGRELTRAESAFKEGIPFIQDAAPGAPDA